MLRVSRKRRLSALCNPVEKVADEERMKKRKSERAIISARRFALFLPQFYNPHEKGAYQLLFLFFSLYYGFHVYIQPSGL